jgi:DNA-binding IscR family transcriptional regulator
LIKSQRGLHGGSVLKRDASEITVYDTIQAVDPIQRIERCPLGIAGHGTNLCPLHRQLDHAIATVERAFQNASIEDLVASDTGSKPLCQVPVAVTTKGRSSRRKR